MTMRVQSTALTAQFYEWERHGRGWAVAKFPCELEPPFRPFPGHYIRPSAIIDDGKVAPWWRDLAALFAPTKPPLPVPAPAQPIAYPDTSATTLIIFSIAVPRHFRHNSVRMEQLLVMLAYRGNPVSFEIIGTEDEIAIQLTTRPEDALHCHTQVQAFFPELAIAKAAIDMVESVLDASAAVFMTDYGLDQEFMRPIATGHAGDHDSYTPLFAILDRLSGNQAVVIQLLFNGAHHPWGEHMVESVSDCAGKSFFIDAQEMPQLAREKASKPLFGVSMRTLAAGASIDEALEVLKEAAVALMHMSGSPFNSLVPLQDAAYAFQDRLDDMLLRQTHRVGMLLNVSELATFAHVPAVQSLKLHHNTRATNAAPSSLSGHPYVLGMNEHQGLETIVSIAMEQRFRHLHVMGATGTGKSTLLKSLIMQDIHEDVGLMCLDPHGDLIEDILNAIPESRIKDVVLIDPSDAQFPIALNILTAHSDLEKELLASDLVALFRRFSTSWGDQMNSVFANAILAFVYNTKRFHLGDLRRFLIEAPYRTRILSTVADSDIVYYWQHEFPLLKGASIGSILTRLDSFLRPKVIRNMVCQQHSLDFAHLMDTGKIVLVKLSQGLMGAENSYLLGAFIVSKLQQIAMARQVQERNNRTPFFCYIDEFQHFVTPSMSEILSGARKYGLGLILSHQDMQQVSKFDTEIASSVLANAGTRICFRLGDADAKRLEDGFAHFSATDLQNLSVGEAIARVNTTRDDFNLDIMPFEQTDEVSLKDAIREQSRATYSVPIVREEVMTPILETIQEPIIPTPTAPQAPTPKAPELTTQPATELREHRYLQTFVKALAEGHGYKAQLEVPTPDGTGQVDVLLEKDGKTIAVEISVTNTTEYEVHNIQKCLAAKYERIAVCSSNAKKLAQVERLAKDSLAPHEQSRIAYVSPDDFITVLTASPQTETPTVMKGYRVKVQYDEKGVNNQELVKRIIRGGKQ